jgi:signal transduction histidine kinase
MYLPTSHKVRQAALRGWSLSASLVMMVILAIMISSAAAGPHPATAAVRDSLGIILPFGPRTVDGWPVILGNSMRFTPAVADIDGDGKDEIAVGLKDCRVFLLDGKGRTMPGWPRDMEAWPARGQLLDDVDGDGEYELMAGSVDGYLHMWRKDGSAVAGWPIQMNGLFTSAPILVRSGNSGKASILVSVAPHTVCLLDPLGKNREGWPKTLPQKTNATVFDSWPTHAVDLDRDGTPEVLHMTSRPPVLYAWYLSGEDYPGFPIELEYSHGWGLAVDDPADPRHIACMTTQGALLRDLISGRTNMISQPDTNMIFWAGGWFISSGQGGDSRPDLLMACTNDGHVYLWDLEGRPAPGWPVHLEGFIYGLIEERENHVVYGPPVTADVDGDGSNEIILGSYDHHLYCFEFDGSPVPGWPIVLDDFIIQTIALAQLDGEGARELVVGQSGETLFAFHLDAFRPVSRKMTGYRTYAYLSWLPEYYGVFAAFLGMMLLLAHLLRKELSGRVYTRGRALRGTILLILSVIAVRVIFGAGDLFRYVREVDRIKRSGQVVEAMLRDEHARVQMLADSISAGMRGYGERDLSDPMGLLRCLERYSDRYRLDYRFNGLLAADPSGRIIQGVGLARGWTDLSQLKVPVLGSGEPVLLGDIPVYVAEGRKCPTADGDTLRVFLISSLLNRVPTALADSTGFSVHIRVNGRTMAWGGAGSRPYSSLRPWVGIVQPAREIVISETADGSTVTALLVKEDFENPLLQWLDLIAVLVFPVLFLLLARWRGFAGRVRLRWWWVITFGALYVAGALMLHGGRFDVRPVPIAGRRLEVLLHMAGITGVVVVLYSVVTSQRSLRLNFALLGSYLIVSLIPLTVIMIIGGNLFLGIQRDIIQKTIADLETRADDMVLSYTGNVEFVNRLRQEGPKLLEQSTETSWLNFVRENQYLFNYDLPSAYLTLWAHDIEDQGGYFTGYSYRAPRTGKLYSTAPGWTGGDNVRGLFLDNGTAVIMAMRVFSYGAYEMEIVSHIPIDDRILSEMEARLRVLSFFPRIYLEPAWLESLSDRRRPGGWYIPYSSELVLQARDWQSGKPRWIVYKASMYIPAGGETLRVLIPVALLILLPLGLSLWGAYTTFRRTARPLTHLLTGIRRVGEGDLDYRLGETGQSEIGRAAKSFDAMAESLEETIREVAEKRKVEEVSELKSRFISMVSHDLKTPLSSIKGATENILEEVAGPVTERQRRYLEMIIRSSGDLQRMITDLLDLSRIESGRLVLDVEPLDLRRETEDLLRSVAPLLEKKGLTGRLDVTASGTTVKADRTRVWQILNNIVSNAVRHSPAGGTIVIGIEDAPVDETDERRIVRISVRDEGPGIQEQDLPRLFEPFFYRSPYETGVRGAGLGLAIVKQLVELHGGSVFARNTEGGGAVFTFTLPV